MVNSILIGKYVHKFIKEDVNLYNDVKGQVFPLIVNKSATFPYICYQRTEVHPEYCKDGNYQDDVLVTIVCVSDDYEQGLELANMVREDFELLTYEDEKIYIQECTLTGVSETTAEDSYVQTLTFNFRIQ